MILLNIMQEWADRLSDCSGIKKIPDLWNDSAQGKEVKLEIPGCWQTDSYSCGGIAGYSIVKALRPKASFSRVYRTIAPIRGRGTSTTRLVRALRRLGVGVAARNDLSLHAIIRTIDRGFPIALTTGNEQSADHWVVLYGYSRKPTRIFLMGEGYMFFSKAAFTWREFQKIWVPKGNGLACWGRG